MIVEGTPFSGYAQLTTASPGPTALALTVNGQSYSATTSERLHVTTIVISTNDSAAPLVTVDDGGATPRKLVSAYASNAYPPLVEQIAPGVGRLQFGAVPNATASAVTSTKTVEVVVSGFVSRT